MEVKKFTSLKVILAFFLFQLLGSSAFAGSADGAVITYYAHYFNNGFVFTVANTVNAASCNSSVRFAVDVSTDKGKTVAASIMAAKTSGAQVHVEGANACSIWTGVEDISWVQVK